MGTVPGFLPSSNGLHYLNTWPHEPDLKIPTPVGQIALGDAANGLCGGMAFAVRDLWEAHRLPPVVHENPAPDSPAFNYLVSRLFASFDLPSGVAKYYEWMNVPDHDTWLGPHGVSWRTVNLELPRVRSCIDAGLPAPLGLVRVHSTDPTMLGHNHQVLAYGYDDSGSRTTLRVYDPDTVDRDDLSITFDHPDARHTVTFQYNGDGSPIRGFFFTNGYRPADPSPLFQDGRTTITITSPQANETVGATLTVHVAAPNCSGVELDAYYATDPSDINSVHWHRLATVTYPLGTGREWEITVDTSAIADQGNGGWGTVNLAAIALDDQGQPTPQRDYRRVDLKHD